MGGVSLGDGLAGLVVLALLVSVYFLPLIIAVLRSHPNALALAALNLLLGWTLFGWAGALVWALLARPSVAPRNVRACPLCAEEVLIAARRCRHCQADLPPES